MLFGPIFKNRAIHLLVVISIVGADRSEQQVGARDETGGVDGVEVDDALSFSHRNCSATGAIFAYPLFIGV